MSGAAGSRVSQRRWSFLRAALLKKEVNLEEFSDVTKRSLADINLIEKEQVRSSETDKSHKHCRYKLGSDATLTLRQNDERKIKVNSLSKLRTKEDDADRTGLVTVWPSEEALAYLCVRRSGIFKGKSVIEIGAGAGVAGLALAAVSEARFVLLTDGNSDTVDRLRENIESNREQFGDTQVEAEKLDWSAEGLSEWQEESSAVKANVESFDFIICSDCIYHEKLYGPLSLCIKFLLNQNQEEQEQRPRCWLMCPNRNDGYRKFAEVARGDNLVEEDPTKGSINSPTSCGWTVPEELKESFKRKVEETREFTQDSYPRLLAF